MHADQVRASPRRLLGVGERAADFLLRGPTGVPARFYAYAGGRPTALAFAADGREPSLVALADRLAGHPGVALFRVLSDGAGTSSGAGASSSAGASNGAGDGAGAWSDPDGTVATAYGVTSGEVTVFVLDPNLRVVGVALGDCLVDQVAGLLDGAVHRDAAAEVTAQAPVLLLPRVLNAAQCERLVGVWEQQGSVETGVARASGDVFDAGYKRRRDHTVEDPRLLRELSSAVGRRVMPEIGKAFAFRASRFEGFKIACYDAVTGGYFRAHRDNLTPSTAHRMFALTLNLNDGYQGGQLRFPEYGNQLYRPDAGGALVFSCAHLHEVLDVTAGRRFVLLSFLYGEPTG